MAEKSENKSKDVCTKVSSTESSSSCDGQKPSSPKKTDDPVVPRTLCEIQPRSVAVQTESTEPCETQRRAIDDEDIRLEKDAADKVYDSDEFDAKCSTKSVHTQCDTEKLSKDGKTFNGGQCSALDVSTKSAQVETQTECDAEKLSKDGKMFGDGQCSALDISTKSVQVETQTECDAEKLSKDGKMFGDGQCSALDISTKSVQVETQTECDAEKLSKDGKAFDDGQCSVKKYLPITEKQSPLEDATHTQPTPNPFETGTISSSGHLSPSGVSSNDSDMSKDCSSESLSNENGAPAACINCKSKKCFKKSPKDVCLCQLPCCRVKIDFENVVHCLDMGSIPIKFEDSFKWEEFEKISDEKVQRDALYGSLFVIMHLPKALAMRYLKDVIYQMKLSNPNVRKETLEAVGTVFHAVIDAKEMSEEDDTSKNSERVKKNSRPKDLETFSECEEKTGSNADSKQKKANDCKEEAIKKELISEALALIRARSNSQNDLNTLKKIETKSKKTKENVILKDVESPDQPGRGRKTKGRAKYSELAAESVQKAKSNEDGKESSKNVTPEDKNSNASKLCTEVVMDEGSENKKKKVEGQARSKGRKAGDAEKSSSKVTEREQKNKEVSKGGGNEKKVENKSKVTEVGGKAKVAEVGGKAKVAEVGGKAKVAEVGGKAKVAEVGGKAKVAEVGGKAKVAEGGGKAKVAEVEAKAKVAEVEAKAKVAEVEAKAKVAEVESKSKVTEVESKSKVAEVAGKAKVAEAGSTAKKKKEKASDKITEARKESISRTAEVEDQNGREGKSESKKSHPTNIENEDRSGSDKKGEAKKKSHPTNIGNEQNGNGKKGEAKKQSHPTNIENGNRNGNNKKGETKKKSHQTNIGSEQNGDDKMGDAKKKSHPTNIENEERKVNDKKGEAKKKLDSTNVDIEDQNGNDKKTEGKKKSHPANVEIENRNGNEKKSESKKKYHSIIEDRNESDKKGEAKKSHTVIDQTEDRNENEKKNIATSKKKSHSTTAETEDRNGNEKKGEAKKKLNSKEVVIEEPTKSQVTPKKASKQDTSVVEIKNHVDQRKKSISTELDCEDKSRGNKSVKQLDNSGSSDKWDSSTILGKSGEGQKNKEKKWYEVEDEEPKNETRKEGFNLLSDTKNSYYSLDSFEENVEEPESPTEDFEESEEGPYRGRGYSRGYYDKITYCSGRGRAWNLPPRLQKAEAERGSYSAKSLRRGEGRPHHDRRYGRGFHENSTERIWHDSLDNKTTKDEAEANKDNRPGKDSSSQQPGKEMSSNSTPPSSNSRTEMPSTVTSTESNNRMEISLGSAPTTSANPMDISPGAPPSPKNLMEPVTEHYGTKPPENWNPGLIRPPPRLPGPYGPMMYFPMMPKLPRTCSSTQTEAASAPEDVDVSVLPDMFSGNKLWDISILDAYKQEELLVRLGTGLRIHLEREADFPPWVKPSAAFILLCPSMEVPLPVILDDWLLSLSNSDRQLIFKVMILYKFLTQQEFHRFSALIRRLLPASSTEFSCDSTKDDLVKAVMQFACQEVYIAQLLALSNMRRGFSEGGKLTNEELWSKWISKFHDGKHLEWAAANQHPDAMEEKLRRRLNIAVTRQQHDLTEFLSRIVGKIK